jgi:hypothetical protein
VSEINTNVSEINRNVSEMNQNVSEINRNVSEISRRRCEMDLSAVKWKYKPSTTTEFTPLLLLAICFGFSEMPS